MYDFDVIFLLLSSPPSTRFHDMLRLHDAAANVGFHTTVATSPAQLAATGRRFRIIVMDGYQDSDFDIDAVIAAMRRLHNVVITFLADASPKESKRGLKAGAEICLPAGIGAEDFCGALITLSDGDRHLMPADAPGLAAPDTPVTAGPISREPASAELSWTLTHRDWVLCTPQGISIRLTATERDLMTQLFTADDKTVYHAEWDRRYGRVACVRRDKVSALSVLVSRLRRKCATVEIKLPLYVKPGRGYWFAAECRIVRDQEKQCSTAGCIAPSRVVA